MNTKLCVPLAGILAAWLSLSATAEPYDPTKYGQFAPPDAFENGSELAYYGSENEWGPRQFTAQAADEHYKRRGQRHILLVMEGHADEAAQSCREYLERDPHDVESIFNLAVAQCQLGDIDAAFATMQQAVAAGLPFERFVAGPRELLAPLTSSPAFQKFLADHPVKLVHGPMLGAVTDSSAKFWVRTANEANVEVQVMVSQDNGPPVATGDAKTSQQNDYTAIVPITGLKPDTQYRYVVSIDGTVMPAEGQIFRTFPQAGTAVRFRIAHGGCAGFEPRFERMWDTILSFKPTAFLMLGDNVYIDLPRPAGPLHHYTYYQRQSRPEFRRLVRSVPVFVTWDDHDVAFDDVWLGPYRDKPSWKPTMLELQEQNWNNPAYGTAEWPGSWCKFSIGDVDFFLLDCRYYRTNPFAKERTMLGPVQKKWLLSELEKSKATFKVIASAVAWASGAKPGSRDTWDGFSEEREEIFSLIADRNINGVVLLSADRHRSDAWKIPRPGAYPLYDLMSSRLTNSETHKLMPGALFGYNEKCSFGLLTFDTVRRDPQVTYEIVNIDGETVYSLPLTKSELSMP